MGKTYSIPTVNYDVMRIQGRRKLSEDEKYNRQLCHHLAREVFKGNFSSPIRDILTGWNTRVLDVNAGLGTWLAEMSANYSGCTYIGVNSLSSDEDGQPFDVEFIEADIQKEGLPYDDNKFDFITMRFCMWEYSETEWKDIITKELIRCLKPGGWVELMDFDPNFQNPGPTSIKLLKSISNMEHMKNRNVSFINKCEEVLMATNQMENVQKQTEYLPIGKHGGRLGETASQFFHDAINIYLPRYAKDMGIRPRDVSSIAEAYCEEANTHETMAPIVRVFGQKMV